MDEILHHLGARDFCNSLDFRDLRWCKISSIYSISYSLNSFEGGYTGESELEEHRTDAQSACRLMVSCIAHRMGLLGRNRKRLTTTHIPGQHEGALAEVGFTLGAISSTSALLRLFGLNPRTRGRCPLSFTGLPKFFAPSATDSGVIGEVSSLRENASLVVDLLNCREYYGAYSFRAYAGRRVSMLVWGLGHKHPRRSSMAQKDQLLNLNCKP